MTAAAFAGEAPRNYFHAVPFYDRLDHIVIVSGLLVMVGLVFCLLLCFLKVPRSPFVRALLAGAFGPALFSFLVYFDSIPDSLLINWSFSSSVMGFTKFWLYLAFMSVLGSLLSYGILADFRKQRDQ